MNDKIPIFLGEGRDKFQIGEGNITATHANGNLEVDIWLAGEYTVRTNNVSGLAQMHGFIPSDLRKD